MAAPDRFGRYEILAEVGDGSMARVYRAWDPAFGRVVAVKTVKSEHLSSDSAADYLRRFEREGRAAGVISHRNVVRVFDVGPGFIVMEFVEGRTLSELLRERHRYQPEEASGLLAPLADAIDHSHRNGVVHRDVKPANIMVQPDGVPKLMDFGIAHLETSIMTGAGQILGSPSYMAPEQVMGEDVTPAWDIWALAIVAYEMLTGRPPFQGPVVQVISRVIHEDSPPPRQWNAALPTRYDDVFARALARLPEQRYATARELVSALQPTQSERALAQPTPGLAGTSAPLASGGVWSRALALGVASGLLLGSASSSVERDASAEALSAPGSHVVEKLVAAASARSPGSPAIGVSATPANEVTSADLFDAEALAPLENEPALGASAVGATDPSARDAAITGASAGLPSAQEMIAAADLLSPQVAGR